MRCCRLGRLLRRSGVRPAQRGVASRVESLAVNQVCAHTFDDQLLGVTHVPPPGSLRAVFDQALPRRVPDLGVAPHRDGRALGKHVERAARREPLRYSVVWRVITVSRWEALYPCVQQGRCVLTLGPRAECGVTGLHGGVVVGAW